MSQAFVKRGLDSPRLCAEMLLSHVLGCERLHLYMEIDRPASREERDRLRGLVARALHHEPIQYLTGEAWFFGLSFQADRRVLIPRPSTETLVEHVLQHVRASARAGADDERDDGDEMSILDLGTGSGCIAVSLATRLPRARVTATDISGDALDVAAINAARHGVGERVRLLRGDWFAALSEESGEPRAFDVITSNPPYIPDDEWPDVPANVKNHEPTSALRGGGDGLLHVRRIIEEAPAWLAPEGVLLIEAAASNAEAAATLAASRPSLDRVRILRDLENLPRVIVAHAR